MFICTSTSSSKSSQQYASQNRFILRAPFAGLMLAKRNARDTAQLHHQRPRCGFSPPYAVMPCKRIGCAQACMHFGGAYRHMRRDVPPLCATPRHRPRDRARVPSAQLMPRKHVRAFGVCGILCCAPHRNYTWLQRRRARKRLMQTRAAAWLHLD